MRLRTASLLHASLLALVLTGCGFRGPLYLPDEPAAPGAETEAAASRAGSVEPQPAPQSQKRDRSSQTAAPSVPEPAN